MEQLWPAMDSAYSTVRVCSAGGGVWGGGGEGAAAWPSFLCQVLLEVDRLTFHFVIHSLNQSDLMSAVVTRTGRGVYTKGIDLA